MDGRSFRIGGLVLLAAGLLGIIGGAMHGPQPGTVEALAEADLGRWNTSHIAIALAGFLFTVGALFLREHFAGSSGEAWALVGTGSLILAGVSVFAVGALETVGFGHLLAVAEGGQAVAAEHAYQAAMAVMIPFATAAAFVAAAAVATFGLSMLSVGEPWPGWLAWAGIVIGGATLLLEIFGITFPGAAEMLPFYLVNAWLAAAGLFFLGAGRAAPAEAPAEERAPAF